MFRPLALCLALLASATAFAHAPPVGPHGGAQTSAGPYHVEVLVEDRDVTVYLTDHSGAVPRGADAMRGTARLLSTDGTPTSAPLHAARPGMLIGKAAQSLRYAPSGSVDLTTPAGATVRAVFR